MSDLKYIFIILAIIIVAVYGNTQEIRTFYKQVEFQESYQIPYQKEYIIPYQESYEEPIYKSYVSGWIVIPGGGLVDAQRITFNKYESIDVISEATPGTAQWVIDSGRFMITLCETESLCKLYEHAVYNYKTDKVIIGYDIKYKTSYRTEYTTDYKTEYRTAHRTENYQVSKTRFEWLFTNQKEYSSLSSVPKVNFNLHNR